MEAQLKSKRIGNEELNAAAVNYYAVGKGEAVEAAAWAAVRALPESAGVLERLAAADKAAQCTPSGKAAAARDAKSELPENVKKDMRRYRAEGAYRTPESYREFHKNLANAEIEKLRALPTVTIHRVWEMSDGWGDHTCVWVIIEVKNELKKLHWHDGNQEFFESHKCGGSSPFRLD